MIFRSGRRKTAAGGMEGILEISKVLVISDSHGRSNNAIAAIEREKPFDLLVHLGDVQGSTQEIQKAAGCSAYFVCGKCDYDPDLPSFTVFYLGKHKVYAAHGHRHQVNYGTEALESSARQYGCDVAMFGHTHVPYIYQKKDMLLLNPGSISLPRQKGYQKSYILLSPDKHGNLIPELKFL